MQRATKRLLWQEAYKLMNAKTADGNPKPFSIRYACKDGRIIEIDNVQKAVSYDKEKGLRRLLLENGAYRYVYDVLILQINETKIMVK